jgi:hypothetical protein
MRVSLLITLLLLNGCASTPKPYVPEQLPQISAGKARILVSRESQLAGARWNLDLVDIGEGIAPNGLIAYRFLRTDYFVTLDSLPRERLSGNLSFDFFWRNPNLIKSLYCGNGKQTCERSFGHGFYRGDLGLLWDSGVALGLTGKNNLEVVQNGRRLLEDLDPTLQFINKIFGQERKPEYPPLTVARKFQELYKRPSLIPLMESIRSGQLSTSLINEPIDLGIFGTQLGEPTLHPEVAADLGKLGGVAMQREDFKASRLQAADMNILLTTGMPYFRVNTPNVYNRFMLIDDRDVSRQIQVIDQLGTGDTVVWEREPGLMRLALIWYDGIDIMPQDIMVEAGKTYHIHYTVRHPKTARWEILERDFASNATRE